MYKRQVRKRVDVPVEGSLPTQDNTHPVPGTGTITGPAEDPFGNTKLCLSLETVVDRTEFDIKWNMPLPNGEPALGNEVTLKADLTLVAQEA